MQWRIFLSEYDSGHTYLGWLMTAWGWTLLVALSALLVALVVGLLAGIARTTSVNWLVFLGDACTELMRNVPLLVQVFLWYYAAPALYAPLQAVPGFVLVVLALGFYTSARISEQIKAGIQALPRGQRNAGLALGLTLAQTYRYVLVPHALRILAPPLTSEAMTIVKNSSVAFAVSVPELTMFAMQAQEETSRGVEIYLAVTALYFISSFAVGRAASLIAALFRVPGMLGAKP